MNVKLHAGIAVIAVAIGGLGMASAASTGPVTVAPTPVAPMSTTSSVGASSGHVVLSVNGRECRVDAKDVVSVSVVSEGSNSYIEITDRYGGTRRIKCG